MSNHALLEMLDTLADAPDGIAQLRALVLRLAVRGLLVRQDSDDDAAEGMVQFSIKELAGLGPVRGRDATVERHEGDAVLSVGPPKSTHVPTGWTVVPLLNVARLESGHTPTPSRPSYWGGPFPWLGIRDAGAHHGRTIHETEKTVTQEGINNSATRLLPAGTVCLSRTASVGYVTVMGCPMCTSQDFVNFVCSRALLPRYLQLVFLAEQEALRRFAKGAVHLTIYFPEVKAFFIKLPPLAEQSRILARVDELTALMDRLDAAQSTREIARTTARDAALAALRHANDEIGVQGAWNRIACQMEDIFANPSDVAPLRRTILELAVRGRLAKQDPSDEQASILLARIETERARLPQDGSKRRVTEQPAPVSDGEAPFAVPAGWAWCRFGAVANIAARLVRPQDWPDALHVAPDSIEKATGRLLVCRTVAEAGVISGNHRFRSGQILYSKIRPNLSKVITVDFDGLCSADMYPIDAFIDRSYLHAFMLSQTFVKAVTYEDNRVAMPKVNQDQLRAVLVAVPPMAEQQRIVSKVGQLMTLCDELESRLRVVRDAQAAFAASAVHHLDI